MPGTPDLLRAYAALTAARPAYARAEAFYKNTVDEFHASPKAKRLLAKAGLNDLDGFNFSRVPVDAVANQLYINALTTGDDFADSVIEDVWDENELGLEAPILHRNVCKYGDAYVMVWPATDEDGEVSGLDLINEDPLTVRVFYNQVNQRRKSYAIKSWTEGDGSDAITYAFLYYPDRVERWFHVGRVPKSAKGNDKWEPYSADGQDSVLPNPLGFVPFYHFRTDRPYGEPEHINAYGPQLTINKLVASHVATIDYQSFPQRYSLAEPGTFGPNYQQGEIDPFSPDDADSDPESLDTASQLEADPGTVWAFENTKAVGQFEAANADVFLKPFDRYLKAMAQATGTPFHFFESTGNATSGESRVRANELFYDKVQARQDSIGFTWGQLWTDALEFLGLDVERVDVVWRPIGSVANESGLDALKLKRELGVPNDVLLVEAGYPRAEVEKWLGMADDDSGRDTAVNPSIPETGSSTGPETV
ncbi:phage portal protein [Streptomyces sp. ISL-10]|uniref:phage portal protein n=1 Tax=Streptomyces sp. ISL-10 TaxID=2819172 RepID=UPI001BE50788|nr:phage portal protein [Streptomyces sp. ISL-10]MBT2365238.1 phage portal protein [Streptomyces sp. ISL-10]